MGFDLTRRAKADVKEIADAIAGDNPMAAERLVAAFQKRWASLARHPYAGRPRADLLVDTRQTVVGTCVSLYRVTDDGVDILRVMHTRRQIMADDLTD